MNGNRVPAGAVPGASTPVPPVPDMPVSRTPFCGSYRPEDVEFLLKPITLEPIADLVEKERLIQSGERHYSEMLTPEKLPSPRYLAVFRDACEQHGGRMALDCLRLARLMDAARSGPLVLVSLARAGTPVGVILCHLLRQVFRREVCHYSISIVRDRGIDSVALRHILARGHAPESVLFVDGWTGKGVISRELTTSVAAFNATHGTCFDQQLYVLSDLAGTAACAASADDYLIPSSILNATVSGLISRSVLGASQGTDDFHGCVYFAEFEPQDQSRAFVDRIVSLALAQYAQHGLPTLAVLDRAALAARSGAFIRQTLAEHGVEDLNLIKPGIGEATRVLLRRLPRLLILRDAQAPSVAHLRVLAEEKQVPIRIDPNLPYQAVSLIRSVSDA